MTATRHTAHPVPYTLVWLLAALLASSALGAPGRGGGGKPPKGSDDTTAPDAVDDLYAEPAALGAVVLTFTAVGDDAGVVDADGATTCHGSNGNYVGDASSYDVRYSTSSIDNETDFDAAAHVIDEPPPTNCGRQQTLGVCGLMAGTTYYFTMKVLDDAGNTSGLSNLTSTLPGVAPGNSVHIHDVWVSWSFKGNSKPRFAGVYIRDENGVRVEGATVWGHWTGEKPTKNETSAVTNCLGLASFDGGNVRCSNGGTVLEFTVTAVTHATAQYDSAANVETSADIWCN
jgi:hypothetical protein